ncbi:MAG TPA: hypothetical protein VN947_22240 [Polyangia bacterium]|nr:hypothetical protein [Polyangia bacterium]
MRVVVVAPLLVVLWIAAVARLEHQLNDAVAALPDAMQAQMYRRTYDELATVCSTQPGLDGHCADEAALLLRFPQCDGGCKALARRFFPVGTR